MKGASLQGYKLTEVVDGVTVGFSALVIGTVGEDQQTHAIAYKAAGIPFPSTNHLINTALEYKTILPDAKAVGVGVSVLAGGTLVHAARAMYGRTAESSGNGPQAASETKALPRGRWLKKGIGAIALIGLSEISGYKLGHRLPTEADFVVDSTLLSAGAIYYNFARRRTNRSR